MRDERERIERMREKKEGWREGARLWTKIKCGVKGIPVYGLFSYYVLLPMTCA